MQQAAPAKKNHKKLVIILAAVALLIAGYFIYKYAYIYTERRKYDQAAVPINKVADDLRAQGINTEFSKGCTYQNPETNTGILTCSESIKYETNSSLKDPITLFNNFISLLNNGSFTTKTTSQLLLTGNYSQEVLLKATRLKCSLYYSDHLQGDYWVGLSCGDTAKFSLF